MNQVGKHIKKLRTAQGMTQDRLAEKLFVSRQTVSNYETGKSCPDIDMLLSIAEALQVDAGQLIYGPSPAPGRKTRKLQTVKLAVLTAVTALLGLSAFYLFRFGKETVITKFDSTLNYVCLLLLWPGFYLLLGRTMLEAAEVFFSAKQPRGRCVPYVRRGLWTVSVLYLLLAIPNLADLAIAHWKSRNAGSFFWEPLQIPIYSWFADHLRFFAVVHYKYFFALFFLLGMVSWAVKRKKSPAQKPEGSKPTEA